MESTERPYHMTKMAFSAETLTPQRAMPPTLVVTVCLGLLRCPTVLGSSAPIIPVASALPGWAILE